MRRLGANRHAGGDPGHRGGRRGSSAARWNPRRRLGADGAAPPAGHTTAATAAENPSGPEVDGPSLFEAYVAAFLALDRHELAAMALTLGILCFAVVTAILLVRTRARLVDTEAAARDEGIAAKAAVDRAYALLLAEPQILVAWAAGSRPPRNHRRSRADRRAGRTAPRPGVRHLAAARPRDRDGACRRGAARPRPELRAHPDHAQRPHRRGRWPGGRRPRDPAAAGTDRGQIRARRTDAAPPQADRGHRGAAGADRRHAVTGLDPRQRRQAELRQCRLCACRRGQERRRCGRTRPSSCSAAQRAPKSCAPTRSRQPTAAACRRSSPAIAAPST